MEAIKIQLIMIIILIVHIKKKKKIESKENILRKKSIRK
jgi:hypothetical protein